MKTFMIATATAALVAGSAMAASESDAALILKYVPNAEITELSETQVETLVAIAHGGGTESEKLAQMRSILGDESIAEETMGDTEATVIEVEPGVGTSPSDVNVVAGNADDGTVVATTANPISEAEMILIEKYADGYDLSTLPEDKLQSALSIIYGGDMENDKRMKVKALFES